MKIAIATPILYDANSPFNHLFKDIIGAFLDAGHEIIRFVAVRNETEKDYSFGYDNDHIRYETFLRKDSERSNIFSRYLRDSLTAIREAKSLSKKEADVLFEDLSYSSYHVVKAAKKRGMRVVVMIQDVWPDNAVQSGLVSQKGLLYRFFESRQRKVYKLADQIVCISDDMKSFIEAKGVDPEKIEVVYNWGYRDAPVTISWDQNLFVQKYNLEKEKFYAVYAGNIGKMQNVELMLQAADLLKDEPDVRFLIVGDGSRRSVIEETAKGKKNVTLLPLQPKELAEHVYSMAGVNVILLVKGGEKTAMPSKTGVVLSCGRPVVFSFGKESKFAERISGYETLCNVSPSDARELADAIRMIKSRNQRDKHEANELFMKSFRRTDNIRKYVEIISRQEHRL